MLVDHAMMARRTYDAWTATVPVSPVHAPAVALNTTWGMTQALRTLWAGGALVLSHTAALHAAVLRHGVTSIACAPVVLAEILAAMPPEAPPPPTLQRVEVSGSALPTNSAARPRHGCARSSSTMSARPRRAASPPPPSPFSTQHRARRATCIRGVRAEAVDETHRPLPPGEAGS